MLQTIIDHLLRLEKLTEILTEILIHLLGFFMALIVAGLFLG